MIRILGFLQRRATVRSNARRAIRIALLSGALASCAGGVPRWLDPDPQGVGPEPGIARYEADVSFDLAAQALSATWRIAYLSDSGTADAARFVLHPGLTVTEVRGPDVARFRVEPPAEGEQLPSLVVEMDTTLAPGTLVALEIRYAGQPGVGEGMINAIAPDRVELNLDGFWHPVAATFDQRLVGIARLRLPEDWEVVAPGVVAREDGVHVVRTSVPQVDVAFIAAPRFRVMSGVFTTVYHQDADSDAAVVVREVAESCGSWLNERFAARDSLTNARIVLTARPEVGYARGSYIVLSRVDPTARVGLARYLCHELAHTWAVSANFMSPHHWMSEAFAELASARFVREEYGDAEYARIVAQWEAQGGARGPVWTPESTRRPGHAVMYRRAPLLLHQLEERIGRERFERFLTLYMVEGARTTPDLLAHLRAVAGADAENWFRDALARPS